MGETNQGSVIPDNLITTVASSQVTDLREVEKYYDGWSVPRDILAKHKPLLKICHQFAYIVGLWNKMVLDIPSWVVPYYDELTSDAIHVLDAAILGSRKDLHLFLRSCIEDTLRYIFYFHHQIEHEKFESNPQEYQSIQGLFDWVESHPRLKSVSARETRAALRVLGSDYSELSKTVHGTMSSNRITINVLGSLHKPLVNVRKEQLRVKRTANSIVFLLCALHVVTYRKLSQPKKTVANSVMTAKQVRALAGLC